MDGCNMKFEFWMRGTECLKAATKRFLNSENLTGEELDLLKDYVIKWIETIVLFIPDYMTNFKEGIGSLKNGKMLMQYIERELLPAGIDPF